MTFGGWPYRLKIRWNGYDPVTETITLGAGPAWSPLG